MLTLPPLSLYVHFPWCVRKCPYCDFNSHTVRAGETALPEDAYLQALLNDLQQEQVFAQSRKLHSIFFGGGTPSLMSGATVAAVLDAAERMIGFERDIEITLEANPGTAEQQRFGDYRAAGINRISLGAQSFDNAQLHILGRIHSSDETRRAVAAARHAGFDNLNLDLMFALPGQDMRAALVDVQQAIALEPEHLSWYQLTIEQNTVFHRQPPPALPDDDAQADILHAGQALLREHGYAQYETSAYSQRGWQCRHNRQYWEFADYLGIGAGAHGKVTQLERGKWAISRRQKTRLPEHYMNRVVPCSHHQQLDAGELPVEFMLNALRLTDGVPRTFFTDRTGLSFDTIAATVQWLTDDGLLAADPQRLAPTAKGALFLNDVVEKFLVV